MPSRFLAIGIILAVSASTQATAQESASGKIAELLRLSWECPPPTATARRVHLSWGTTFDRDWRFVGRTVTFVGHRDEIVHNTEANEITKIGITSEIDVPLDKIGNIEVAGNALSLTCSGTEGCFETRSSTRLSTDCAGFCGGQPWSSSRSVDKVTLRFCDSDSATSAAEAMRRLAPEASIGSAGSTAAEARPLVCWVTDPTGTPLNVRSRPNGKLTGSTLANSKPILVARFSKDPKGRPWAEVTNGFAYAKFLTCQSPDS